MLHFAKIPKKMVKFGENSAKFGHILPTFAIFFSAFLQIAAFFLKDLILAAK